jgi:putative SOS response-associated peptidase YedK
VTQPTLSPPPHRNRQLFSDHYLDNVLPIQTAWRADPDQGRTARDLDFPAFRAEIQKVFRRDIPLAERDDWEAWLKAQRAEHDRLTRQIIDLETELNDRVYHLYSLTPDEIHLIEQTTKYPYGEV